MTAKKIASKILDMPLVRGVYRTAFWNRRFKNSVELNYWREILRRIGRWYEGEEAFRYPFPAGRARESRFDQVKNAVLSYVAAETENASYLSDLSLRADSFSGLRVGDIGSGPLPTLLVFDGCERFCIDHLITCYRDVGYPLDHYERDITFVESKAEAIDLADGALDVMISRNALDHVDDFEAAAAEIRRVVGAGGYVHLLLNYHHPTKTETQALSDSRVGKAFPGLGLRKLRCDRGAWGFDDGETVLWTNLADEMLELAAPMVMSAS